MFVIPHERLVYWVQSESGKEIDPYRVDLTGYNGNGECNCMNFKTKHGPVLSRTPPLLLKPSPATRCKHIRAAREYFTDEAIGFIVKQETEPAPEPKSEYGVKRAIFLAAHPYCMVCATAPSVDIHHSKGRAGALELDDKYWVATCRLCHNLIHTDVAWAKAEGWILDGWNHAEPKTI